MERFIVLESATKTCSVALFEDDNLIDLLEEKGSYSHAENLAPFVDQLLKQNQLKLAQISAVAISKGPGSYTGLRIGASLAKGLCYAGKIPLIAISTLEAMAAGALSNHKANLFIPMLDARRMEVYCCVYDKNFNLVNPIAAKVIDNTTFDLELKQQKVCFFGDGAEKCKEIINSPSAIFPERDYISAAHYGSLVLKRFLNKEFEDLAYFEPFYLKEFISGATD